MPQTLYHVITATLQTVAHRLAAAHAALLVSDPESPDLHLLVEVGEMPAAAWQTLIGQAPANLLMVSLGHPGDPGQTVNFCLYDARRAGWTEPERFAVQITADSLANMISVFYEDPNQVQLAASRRILSVNEEELCRIVLDIHDGPVQKLFAALNILNHIQHVATEGPSMNPELAGNLRRVTVLLEASLSEIKTFLGTFRPPEFAKRSLIEVFEGLIIQHEQFTGASVYFEAPDSLPQVSVPVKIALYRIVQEALSNAYRHAGVDEHFLRLWAEGDLIYLEVRDYGKGFQPPTLEGPLATEATQHIGLRGMRDRIHLVGGSLRLHSAPGEGTAILVSVPAGA